MHMFLYYTQPKESLANMTPLFTYYCHLRIYKSEFAQYLHNTVTAPCALG